MGRCSTRSFVVDDSWIAQCLGVGRKRTINARLQLANFGLQLDELTAINDWLRLHILGSPEKHLMALVPNLAASVLH